ncbi:MAG: hypothetical protein GYB55_19985 [Cytophagales bacterium]|uniref:hypothetical protein n=1 Tax=Cyclobacterium marinum TaxID=104 RepID=UPI0030D8CE16|nr:hypothetical protein [Cytophagales bacterium]
MGRFGSTLPQFGSTLVWPLQLRQAQPPGGDFYDFDRVSLRELDRLLTFPVPTASTGSVSGKDSTGSSLT